MTNKSHKTFMPLLCRFSKTDTVQPIKHSADPSSPKLTCIGQMKKKSTTTNHLFLAGNLSDSGNTKSSGHSNRYKLFSGIDTSKCVTNRSKSCNGRGRTPIRSNKYYSTSSDDHDIVRVVVAENLHPPLPVVKCGRRDQELNVNLWKRRGVEMKTLQIQPVKLSVCHNINNNNGGCSVSPSATT